MTLVLRPFVMNLNDPFSSGASHFSRSSLRCFYTLIVVNSIDWALFGKAHTCLYKVSQLTIHFRARCFFASGLSCVFHWGEASLWPLCHKAQISEVLQRWLSFWKFLPSPHRISGAEPEWPSGSWSPLLPRPLSRDCSGGRVASSRKSPGCSKLLPFKNYGDHCALGNLQYSRMFCSLPHICASTQSSLWALPAVPSFSWLFVALICIESCETLYRQSHYIKHIQ